MKRILMLVAVAGLVILAADGSAVSSAGGTASDNVSAAPDIMIGVQSDDGSFYVVRLEVVNADNSGPVTASSHVNVLHQLPDTTTLILLGLGGLLYRRRKNEKTQLGYLRII